MGKRFILYIRQVGIKFYFITHHFKLEFADSGLLFVQDESNFIYPLLKVVSGTMKKVSGLRQPKINGSDRIRILIPEYQKKKYQIVPYFLGFSSTKLFYETIRAQIMSASVIYICSQLFCLVMDDEKLLSDYGLASSMAKAQQPAEVGLAFR